MRTIRRLHVLVMAALLLAIFAGGARAHPEMNMISGPDTGPELPGMAFCTIEGGPHCGEGDPAFISIVRSERGVALRTDGETIPVRLRVEKVRGIDPSRVRRLLEENRTLGEIRAEIEGDDRAYSYRGNLRLGRAHYLLEDLKIIVDGENSTLKAELLEPVWGEIPAPPAPGLKKVGKIAIDTLHQDGTYISVGSLVIRSGPFAGSYVIVMDPSIVGGRGAEASAASVGDMIRLEERSEDLAAHRHLGRPPYPGWGWRGREVSIWGAIRSGPGAVVISSTLGPACWTGSSTSEPFPGDTPGDNTLGDLEPRGGYRSSKPWG